MRKQNSQMEEDQIRSSVFLSSTANNKTKINNKKSGDDETRTRYLIAASDALSQVSYDPMCIYCTTVSSGFGLFSVSWGYFSNETSGFML